MKTMNYLTGIILIGMVIAISGCTNTNTPINNTTSHWGQLKLFNTPLVELNPEDGSYMISAGLENTGTTDLKNIKVLVNGLDETGNIIANATTLIATIKAGEIGTVLVTLRPKGGREVVAADVIVINATTS